LTIRPTPFSSTDSVFPQRIEKMTSAMVILPNAGGFARKHTPFRSNRMTEKHWPAGIPSCRTAVPSFPTFEYSNNKYSSRYEDSNFHNEFTLSNRAP